MLQSFSTVTGMPNSPSSVSAKPMPECGVIGDHSMVRRPASVVPWTASTMRMMRLPPAAPSRRRTIARHSPISPSSGKVSVDSLRCSLVTVWPA
jgi:hypothetical protein